MSNKITIKYSYEIDSEFYYCTYNGLKKRNIKKHDLVELINNRPDSVDAIIANGVITNSHNNIEHLDIGNFLIDEPLFDLCASSLIREKRDAYTEAEKFLEHKDTQRKVGIVYGMRSTGKTVILHQLAGRIESRDSSAYLTLNYGEYDIGTIYKWISSLRKLGIKNIFIDEVTWATGFIDCAMEFADKWATYSDMKVILSGTDSLAFTFAMQESLHGRYKLFKITRMSFPEYHRLTNNDIIEYVRNGGVFLGDTPLDEYLQSSVVQNIRNSINNTARKIGVIEDLRFVSEKDMYAMCYAICESVANSYIRRYAAASWSNPVGKIIDSFLSKSKVSIAPADKSQIKNYTIGFSSETTEYSRDIVDSLLEVMLKIGFLTSIEYRTERRVEEHLVFAQTGIAWEFARLTIDAIMQSGLLSGEHEARVIEGIQTHTEGELLELSCLIVLAKQAEKHDKLDTCLAKFRLHSGDREVDAILFNRKTSTLYLYEVKRSTQFKSEYAKHLSDNEFVSELQRIYGANNIVKTVLYRGADTDSGVSVSYKNIENYLISIENGDVF